MTRFDKLNALANVCLILTTMTLTGMLAWPYLRPYVFKPQPMLGRGDRMPSEDIDWKANKNTVVLVLNKDCRFCTASAPFYRKLIADAAAEHVTFVAIMPHPVEVSRQYLKEMHLDIADVRQKATTDLHLSGTPTLIHVDAFGIVKDIWYGQLRPQSEGQVTAAVIAR